jgi:DNA repair exonuclease SbcCD ATPase subunit
MIVCPNCGCNFEHKGSHVGGENFDYWRHQAEYNHREIERLRRKIDDMMEAEKHGKCGLDWEIVAFRERFAQTEARLDKCMRLASERHHVIEKLRRKIDDMMEAGEYGLSNSAKEIVALRERLEEVQDQLAPTWQECERRASKIAELEQEKAELVAKVASALKDLEAAKYRYESVGGVLNEISDIVGLRRF